VFDDATDGVVAFGDDDRYVYANQAALRLYERPLVGEVVGRFAVAPVDGRMKQFKAAGSGAGEVAIRTAAGTVRRLRYRGMTNYGPDMHLSVFRAAEPTAPAGAPRGGPRAALFHAVFDHLWDAALLIDDERCVLAGNRAVRRLLGVNRGTLLTTRIDDYIPAGKRGELERAWSPFVSLGSMELVCPIRLPNGLERTVRLRGTASITPGRHLITLQVVRRAAVTGESGDTEASGAATLTFREREVLTWLARGIHAPVIAEQLSLSAETVRTHTRNAMTKLGARSRPHAVALAIQQGQIEP
jgi:DNA-binding CsgD family transcriptional regulator/PAS domain-containing protein